MISLRGNDGGCHHHLHMERDCKTYLTCPRVRFSGLMYHQVVVLDLGVCTPLPNIPGTHPFVPQALNVVLVVGLWSQCIIIIIMGLSWGDMPKNSIWHELLSRMHSVLEVEEACICIVR
jgi:hypothetical protein